MTKGNAMLTAEADIRTEHAARYLARLCGHAGKMATAGRRLGHRRAAQAHGDAPPGVRRVSNGLRVRAGSPPPKHTVTVLPTSTAPSRRSARTQAASVIG